MVIRDLELKLTPRQPVMYKNGVQKE